jgi:8-amino-7-oxononanoate synthase
MSSFIEELSSRLDHTRKAGLYRVLRDQEGVDFSSNDYLGLSRHPALRAKLLQSIASGPLSSPGSRLLSGNLPEHRALEERLATFKGTEAALLFPSGYQANVGLLTSLIGRQDRVISDAANHASIIDGLRLSGCEKVIVPHLDVPAIETALQEARARRPASGRTFLITESLFSMDGDIAPLDEYADLADRYGACLIVDDAHATGVYGAERGSGLCEEFGIEKRPVATVSTAGKALGVCGAFVAGPTVVVDYLINSARPFIFTTATPPLLLAAIEAGLDIVAQEPQRRRQVLELAAELRDHLEARGLDCLRSAGPIVPVLLEDNERAVRIADEVRSRGYDVRAIRPPSVAPGTARLRLSVHADHTQEEIADLARAIHAAVVVDSAARTVSVH